MTLQGFKSFREQAFRRIGYTVGLSNLLEFSDLCEVLSRSGSLDIKELTTLVQKRFDNLEPKFARGKIDVAKALGLLFSLRNRYSLSGSGRALLALRSVYTRQNLPIKGFWLKQVVERDADLTLTLLVAVSTLDANDDLEQQFLQSLDQLLQAKRLLFSELVPALTLKRELPTLLTVRDSQPKRPRSSTGRILLPLKRTESPYKSIQISEQSLPHYARHTVTPRKGWLTDLALIDRATLKTTVHGARLLSFLKDGGLLRDDFALIPPDEEALSVVSGQNALPESRPINQTFYDEMISVTYSGSLPILQNWDIKQFLESLTEIYEQVKLKNFEQAELRSIREALLTPLLIQGKTIPFEHLLEETVKAFPDRLYRLSSRRQSGAYISLKRNA